MSLENHSGAKKIVDSQTDDVPPSRPTAAAPLERFSETSVQGEARPAPSAGMPIRATAALKLGGGIVAFAVLWSALVSLASAADGTFFYGVAVIPLLFAFTALLELVSGQRFFKLAGGFDSLPLLTRLVLGLLMVCVGVPLVAFLLYKMMM